MYDKVTFFIDRSVIEPQCNLASCLDNITQVTDMKTGEIKLLGGIENLRASVRLNGVFIAGSLPKYLYGDNIHVLDRRATAQAIEKISDNLHLDVSSAKVTGLEFGANFVMSKPVEEYLTRLGNMPRLERYGFNPSAIYYKGRGKKQQKVVAFYDKIAEAKEKNYEIPIGLDEANILRYELRLKNHLARQMQEQQVTASTLTELNFYRDLLDRYQRYYFSIIKRRKPKPNVMEEIKSVKDARDVLMSKLLNNAGEGVVEDFIRELKEASAFKDPKYYSRLKKELQGIATKSNFTEDDDLIKELDDEVKNCGAYY